jgi:hypothetical protein
VRAASAVALAILVGLVAPLALGSFTWEQRGALTLLVLAWAWHGRARLPLRVGSWLALASLAAVVITLPAAAAAEVGGLANRESRTGQRLVALNDPVAALPHLEAALRLQPGERTTIYAAAGAHAELAEREVAAGLDMAAHARAGDHLARSLALLPNDDRVQRLAGAVAAVRQADVIWNDYDWPRTIGELRKAQTLRPDLPGLPEKLAAAEASYALARRGP